MKRVSHLTVSGLLCFAKRNRCETKPLRNETKRNRCETKPNGTVAKPSETISQTGTAEIRFCDVTVTGQ